MAKLRRSPPRPFTEPVLQEDLPLIGGVARAFRFREGATGRHHVFLCLAGMGANGRSFARQEPLAQRWPFILFNTPNETPPEHDPIAYAADAVEAYLDGEELERPILLASSFGGAVAATVALRRPERVGALVLADGVVSHRQIPMAFHGFVDVLKAPDHLARLVAPMAAQVMGGFSLDTVARDEIVREARVFTNRELKRRLSALLRIDLFPQLAQLEIPSLCVHGGRDMLVPWRRGRWLAEALGGVFLLIRGAGHLPYLTHADEFNARVTRFMNTFCIAPPIPS